MAKTRKEKKVIMAEYNKSITDSKGFIVLKPTKLTPNEANDFRKEIYEFDSTLKVVKNSVFKRALKENNLELAIDKGEYAVVFLKEDIINPSKKLKKLIDDAELRKEEPKVEIISAVLDGNVLTKEQAIELSEMPDKEGSISMILGILDNAVSGIIYVLEDAPRSVVNVLDQAFKE